MNEQKTIHNYYVDEAGDLTLFNKRGKMIVGSPGVSNAFMVGVAHLPDPHHVRKTMEKLRKDLLVDPYFKDVPSMQPQNRKTALCFHAKNDLPEVRREVFKLLPQFGVKVQVAIRRKRELAQSARSNHLKLGQKLNPNHIYDDLVKRLFKNLLHKADENRIVFAIRGKSPRQLALEKAITKSRKNFYKKWHIAAENQTVIQAGYTHEFAGLQVIDYYLWALQRLLERNEDRFFNLIALDFRLIMDLDDVRNKPYGEWYNDKNPLSAQKIKPIAG
jgi:uncharacterized protein DUF3800